MSLERLILIRHGKAEARAPSGEDFDRSLTDRGREEARRTGEWLAQSGFRPGLAVVSAAARTLQTWAEIAAFLPDTPSQADKALYHTDAQGFLDAARGAETEAVAVVGHNPGMHMLAAELAARAIVDVRLQKRISEGFPTSAAAVFNLSDGRIVCEGLYIPKEA